MIYNNETSAIVTMVKNIEKVKKSKKSKPKIIKPSDLTSIQQSALFSHILNMNNLNLFQKILIFDKINLCGQVPRKWKEQFENYCSTIDNEIHDKNLFGRILNLPSRNKYKTMHKYRELILDGQRNKKLSSVLKKVISFTHPTEITPTVNGVSNSKIEKNSENPSVVTTNPIPNLTIQINHVAFCRGEHSHLVIVCTENRLLIWNLLTLRLQSSFKMCVSRICVDLYTSLVAVITTKQDLYVFMPNTPIPLYQHKGFPQIEGMAWIPRTYPRPHSLTIDWQAITELYFLSEKQVRVSNCPILYLDHIFLLNLLYLIQINLFISIFFYRNY